MVRDGLCTYITRIKNRNRNSPPILCLTLISGLHFIGPRTLLSIKPFIDRVLEVKVHSIFLSDRIVFPSASIVIMVSHPRNIFDVIYLDGSE